MRLGGDGGTSWIEAGRPDVYLDGELLNPADLLSADDIDGVVVTLDKSKAERGVYNWFALGLEKALDEERWAAITITRHGKVEFVRKAA